jgi:predicted nucleotidyltransferase
MTKDETKNNRLPGLALPAGTQIVTTGEVRDDQGLPRKRTGSVGKIVAADTSTSPPLYRVLFPDGFTASLSRQELSVRKHVQSINFDRPQINDNDLFQYIIYKCQFGSRAYGLEVEDSDYDMRGIYLAPADMHWSIWGLPEQIENYENQETYYELQKFLVLALKANPNVLECLYASTAEIKTELADELLQNRHRFLSKLVYQTYNGYVLSQFRKLEKDLQNKGEPKWKHVLHLIRLLLCCIQILESSDLDLRVSEHKAKLMGIRRGEIDFAEVDAWRQELHKKLDLAHERTKLPERPDYEWCNWFLLKARRSMV